MVVGVLAIKNTRSIVETNNVTLQALKHNISWLPVQRRASSFSKGNSKSLLSGTLSTWPFKQMENFPMADTAIQSAFALKNDAEVVLCIPPSSFSNGISCAHPVRGKTNSRINNVIYEAAG